MTQETLEELGAYLRECRESLRLPLEEAALRLNFRMKYLQALESGRIDEMPGLVYARGYLRRYSELLGLSGQDTLVRFDHASGKIPAAAFIAPEPTRRQNRPGPAVIVICLVILGVAFALWHMSQGEESSLPSRVSELPERFRRLLEPENAAQGMDKSLPSCLIAAYRPEGPFCPPRLAFTPRATQLMQARLFSAELIVWHERDSQL